MPILTHTTITLRILNKPIVDLPLGVFAFHYALGPATIPSEHDPAAYHGPLTTHRRASG